jgi:hypothetical protein
VPVRGNLFWANRSGRTARELPPACPALTNYFRTVNAKLDARDSLPACSAAESLVRQEPYINTMLAQHALALLARLFR